MPKNQSKAEKEPEKTFSLISNEKLLAIYSAMLKCRLLEQRATALFQHGKLDSDLHVSAGLEATAAAAAVDLEQEDTLCLAPNDWLPAFVKGMSLEAIFRALAPSALQVDGAAQIETEHKKIIVPSGKADTAEAVLSRASEAAAAKKGAVAAVFIASGADSLAQWKKAIGAAGTKKLPMIFVHYSQSADDLGSTSSGKPEALVHGVPSIGVDAHDPVAAYRVAYEAIVRARQLRGATLLECMIDSPALLPKSAGDPPADAMTTDPVASMENYLKSKKIEFEVQNRQVISAYTRDLDLATRFLEK